MPEPNKTTENTESEEEEMKYDWLVRPCELYKSEYKECTSFQARFHQYFVFGKTINCQQWETDYKNCYLWEKYKSKVARDDLVESEKCRRLMRLQGHYRNDVWEKRDKPPEDWNAPLPKWLEERNKNSYLKCVSTKTTEQLNESVKNNCIIM